MRCSHATLALRASCVVRTFLVFKIEIGNDFVGWRGYIVILILSYTTTVVQTMRLCVLQVKNSSTKYPYGRFQELECPWRRYQ